MPIKPAVLNNKNGFAIKSRKTTAIRTKKLAIIKYVGRITLPITASTSERTVFVMSLLSLVKK